MITGKGKTEEKADVQHRESKGRARETTTDEAEWKTKWEKPGHEKNQRNNKERKEQS